MTVFESLLNHDFAAYRQQRTPDGQGGWPMVPVANGTIRGRLRPASSAEREAAQLEERQITHVFYCVAGEDLARGDLVSYGGLTVEIEAKRNPSTADEHWEFDALERQFEVSEEVGS